MKALIVEIRGNSAAALCENSGIVKIPNKGYSVGQQVNIVAKKKSVYRLSAAVACIAMFFGLSTTGYAAFTPYSYVTLDVNPSFEYTLNRFDQVIGVESVNDDAEAVLNEIDIPKFRNIDEVIKLTIDELYNEGYLTGDEKEIMLLSVCGGDDGKTKDLAEKLTDVTTAYEATPDILEVTEDDRKAADDLNTTAGKLALILDIVNKTDKVTEADVEKYVDKSVKEIIAVLDGKTKKPSSTNSANDVNEKDGASDSTGSGSQAPSAGKAPSASNPPEETTSSPETPQKPEAPSDSAEKPQVPSDNDDIDDSDISGPGK